uniref:Uncharacterized protein n=1 Tax=Accipiter nisus TaxID=211598 RepID=A0A8B9RYD2_9AVES
HNGLETDMLLPAQRGQFLAPQPCSSECHIRRMPGSTIKTLGLSQNIHLHSTVDFTLLLFWVSLTTPDTNTLFCLWEVLASCLYQAQSPSLGRVAGPQKTNTHLMIRKIDSEMDISVGMNKSHCMCALSETTAPSAVGCGKDFVPRLAVRLTVYNQ